MMARLKALPDELRGGAWPSPVRAVRCPVNSGNGRDPRPQLRPGRKAPSTLGGLPRKRGGRSGPRQVSIGGPTGTRGAPLYEGRFLSEIGRPGDVHGLTIAYVAGLVAADGSIERKLPYVYVACRDREDVLFAAHALFQASGKKPSIFYDRRAGVYKAKVSSRVLRDKLVYHYNISSGKKAQAIRPPDKLTFRQIVEYVAGWFDGEGWCETDMKQVDSHPYNYPRIGFKIKNKTMRDLISKQLEILRLPHGCYKRKDGTYGIWINGRKNCKAFKRLIGFRYPTKISKLNRLLPD